MAQSFSDMNLLQFAAHLEGLKLAHDSGKATRHALEVAARLVRGEARSEIGHYQAAEGGLPAWPELAESTQEDRSKKGFTSNDPLERTGDLRRSIGFAVSAKEQTFAVGSQMEEAVWQEQGTSKIPPRSFLARAGIRRGRQVAQIVGEHVVAHLSNGHFTPHEPKVDD